MNDISDVCADIFWRSWKDFVGIFLFLMDDGRSVDRVHVRNSFSTRLIYFCSCGESIHHIYFLSYTPQITQKHQTLSCGWNAPDSQTRVLERTRRTRVTVVLSELCSNLWPVSNPPVTVCVCAVHLPLAVAVTSKLTEIWYLLSELHVSHIYIPARW